MKMNKDNQVAIKQLKSKKSAESAKRVDVRFNFIFHCAHAQVVQPILSPLEFLQRSYCCILKNLCKLLKHKVSSPVDESGNMPKITGAICQDFKVYPPNMGTQSMKDSYEEQLQEIHLSAHCLVTTKIYFWKDGLFWGRLARVYKE
uniref:AlNc14C773G12493 protein n=1 Tax=Albugo laibachii Nc14 TaxID=890382 RepID=F0X207_9STRA|nr:AlNc14C773G12493 [Albugo laibachii Nc14]|eukprot:CCA27867.1 AlNc14C773G12493 [Albugo laibachii Nc14]